jgi:hypothetical protein
MKNGRRYFIAFRFSFFVNPFCRPAVTARKRTAQSYGKDLGCD